MCDLCVRNATVDNQPSSPSRRVALGMLGAIPLFGISSATLAANKKTPPKPANVLSPDQAIKRLMAGNKRYTSGKTQYRKFAATRDALAAKQNPYACVLGCADSRVSPELCFDEERGDLFVTRVAGNYVTNDILASLEYGVRALKSPLIMVLGHTQCGAIDAAVSAYEKHTEYPGHIQNIVTAVMPSVRAAANKHQGSLLRAAILENIRHNVQQLQNATPILSSAVRSGEVKIVGGLYTLETGQVELVA